ncbi:MAG: N-6 DNA methylase, partial [Thermodesulfobacteriota bacterium]|nr:N-6 DNA methylase [Thermodesulfobacteriota bacterium]
MILHGIPAWEHRQGDSLRDPRHLTGSKRLKTFDRIIMNPPFSLEDWGYDTVAAGDKFGRFSFGMVPVKNGDWAWLQQIAKSLKDRDPQTDEAGKGMVVMSQGVLFRGQPEQTEEEDGHNQKADAEHLIRRGFIEQDLIECIVVLPSKLFYGNGVPACLLLLNRNKAPERKNRILMIWASRYFQKANPQNMLRPSDLMRILVPWRAFGNLDRALTLVDEHEAQLIHEIEEKRDTRLNDIEDAFSLVLAPLVELVAEQTRLAALDLKVKSVDEAVREEHPYFHPLVSFKAEMERVQNEIAHASRSDKAVLKGKLAQSRAKYMATRKQLIAALKARLKQLNKAIKELNKLQAARDKREEEIRLAAEREISHLHEAGADLRRICADPDEAQRSFAVVDRAEIEERGYSLRSRSCIVGSWTTQFFQGILLAVLIIRERCKNLTNGFR